MSADEEQKMLSAASDKLLEVEQLVDDLHKIAHHFKLKPGFDVHNVDWKTFSKMRDFLNKEQGLQDLREASREEARLRILKAWSLVLQQLHVIEFPGDMFLKHLPELAALSQALQSSTVLKKLRVHFKPYGVACSPETCTLLADIILGATALESLYFLGNTIDGVSLVTKSITYMARELFSLRTLDEVSTPWSPRTCFDYAGVIATLIRAAPNLTQLVISVDSLGDENGAELIGKAIACHQSLQSLRIIVTDEDFDVDECESKGRGIVVDTVSTEHCKRQMRSVGHLLSGAFLGSGHPRNTCIHSLHLEYESFSEHTDWTGDFDILSQVLKMRSNITAVELSGFDDFLHPDLHLLLKSIQGNPHIQSLALRIYRSIRAESLAMLLELIKSNSMHSLKHLAFAFTETRQLVTFDWAAFYAALSQNSTFRSLELREFIGYKEAETQMLDWIQSTKNLQTLSLCSSQVNWRSIFRCLRQNISIATLKISGPDLEDDDTYREFMGMLQVNSTLIKVEFLDETNIPEERRATLEEALRSKARQESYLSEFRRGLGQGVTKWESPKCGRVFLCGLPEAGKTRLAKTMRKLAKGKSWMGTFARLKEKILKRTEGIEIHTLRNDEDMQIRVWDLAGQDIFRALQQFLFPKLSRSSFFIFLFSPCSRDETGKKLEKRKLQIAFEEEFRDWLRFIASNSAVTGFNLPQVMVVLSHKDMFNSSDVGLIQKGIEKIIARFIEDFEDVICIHPLPYFIDGHEPKHVQPILEKLYSTFTELFEERLFRVPTACFQMSQQLVRWESEKPDQPIIDYDTFFSLCGKIPDLRSFSKKIQEDDSMRLLTAVGSYLHDVGTVIGINLTKAIKDCQWSKSNLMVVNPNWLTHEFVGRFISFGCDFQLSREEQLMREKIIQEEAMDGFLQERGFQRWLEPMKEKFPKLILSTWQRLMENLDLLHVIEGPENDVRFFIPTLFAKSPDALQWHPDVFPEGNGNISFVAVRLRCKDSKRTYLSPAFFSRFQVSIWRKLMQESPTENPRIECKFNVICVRVDGFDIVIENDEAGDFIDVLIRSVKSKEMIWDYVETHIVEAIRELCASSKGCPGVELVMDIVRTECVKSLTPCKHRRKQSVSKEDLKRNLILSAAKLDQGSADSDLHWHRWDGDPEANLKETFERALDLVPPKDVQEVRGLIRGKIQLLEARVVKLKHAFTESEKKAHLGRNASTCEQEFSSEDQKMINLIKEGVKELHEDVRELQKDVRDLKREIKQMKELQQTVVESLVKIYQKLDQLIGASMSTTQWPKRPYFTRKDIRLSHRITAVVEIGTPLMLHFQCEEKDGHHFVPDQDGYQIIVGKDKCEVWRQISRNSVRVLCYLLKAGVHITTAMGDLVPQVETLGGDIFLLTSSRLSQILHKVQVEDGSSSKRTLDCCSPEEAWRFLQDFLKSENLNNRITEFFLLYPAQYFDSQSTCSWLCHDCLDQGLKEGKLKKLS